MVRDPCSPLMGRRLKTREQADIIISLDLWSLDVAQMYERAKRLTGASTRLRKSTIRRCRWWVLILVSTLSNLAKLKISRLVPLTVIFGQDQDLQRWTSSALTSWHLLFSHYKTGLPGMSEHVLVTCTQTPTAMGQRRIEYWSWWRSELECILTGIAKVRERCVPDYVSYLPTCPCQWTWTWTNLNPKKSTPGHFWPYHPLAPIMFSRDSKNSVLSLSMLTAMASNKTEEWGTAFIHSALLQVLPFFGGALRRK